MMRMFLLATVSLSLSQANALPGIPADDPCTIAFLGEHMSGDDAATMLRLWTAGSGDPATTGAVAVGGESTSRAATRMLGLRGQYQTRCPAQDLAFE